MVMWSRGHQIRLLWTKNSSLFLSPSSSLQIICTKQDEICMNTTITIYIIQRGWQCSVKEWRFSSYVCIERVRWIIYADRWWIIWIQQLDLKQRSLSSKEKTKTKLFVQSLYMSVRRNSYASKCHYGINLPKNISFTYR